MKKLNKQVQWWHWAGKVLPMIALMVLCLVIVFDLTKIRDIVVCAIAVAFGAVAFTWWWWVMGAEIHVVGLIKGDLESSKTKLLFSG